MSFFVSKKDEIWEVLETQSEVEIVISLKLKLETCLGKAKQLQWNTIVNDQIKIGDTEIERHMRYASQLFCFMN